MSTLKTLRTDILKLRQRDVAEIAGTTQATVSRWERGELAPDLNQIRSLKAFAIEAGLPWDDKLVLGIEVPQ